MDIPEAIINLVEAKARLKTCDGYPEQVERCKQDLNAAINKRIADPLPRKEVISIQPGDVVVINLSDTITNEGYYQLLSDLTDRFPNNKHLVLDSGVTLEVYREQVKDEATVGELMAAESPSEFKKAVKEGQVIPTGNPHQTM